MRPKVRLVMVRSPSNWARPAPMSAGPAGREASRREPEGRAIGCVIECRSMYIPERPM